MKSETDRGVYRSIYTSLWDDPEFLELSSQERLVLIYLRTSPLSNIPCIYRFYREAISDHTGLEYSLCDSLLNSLSHRGWIEVEKGIVWVRNALKYDPAISLKNPKHVEAIRKAIMGLPKLQIIINFCTYYKLEIPYRIGTREGITNPMPFQEQEPEQEPEQEKESEKEPSPKKAKKSLHPSFASDAIEIQIASLLLELIKTRKPDFKEPNIQLWAHHVDLMIRTDKRSQERIEDVIRWCQSDTFWQNNILSAEKLRAKFDQLDLKMHSASDSPKGTRKTGNNWRLLEQVKKEHEKKFGNCGELSKATYRLDHEGRYRETTCGKDEIVTDPEVIERLRRRVG